MPTCLAKTAFRRAERMLILQGVSCSLLLFVLP